MIYNLIKKGNVDTDVHVGRIPCEDEGRGQVGVPTSQGIPKVESTSPEAKRVAWNNSLSQPSEKQTNK